MNTKQKKVLYESIIKSVAKTVKKTLNESNGPYYVYCRKEHEKGRWHAVADGKAYKYSGPYVTKEEALEEAKNAAIKYACEQDNCGDAYWSRGFAKRDDVTFEEFAEKYFVNSESDRYWVTQDVFEVKVSFEVDEDNENYDAYEDFSWDDDEV